MHLVNSSKSQLIATTHNREILKNRDIFRDDCIWFADKTEEGNTEIYSLEDFDTKTIRNSSNVYNAYSRSIKYSFRFLVYLFSKVRRRRRSHCNNYITSNFFNLGFALL